MSVWFGRAFEGQVCHSRWIPRTAVSLKYDKWKDLFVLCLASWQPMTLGSAPHNNLTPTIHDAYANNSSAYCIASKNNSLCMCLCPHIPREVFGVGRLRCDWCLWPSPLPMGREINMNKKQTNTESRRKIRFCITRCVYIVIKNNLLSSSRVTVLANKVAQTRTWTAHQRWHSRWPPISNIYISDRVLRVD